MKIEDVMRQALREFADPGCRRCQGAGFRGELEPAALCRCVAARVSYDPDADTAGDGEMPHPWRFVVQRAQEIHAASLVGRTPDDWSA